jgi:hypothetical protein
MNPFFAPTYPGMMPVPGMATSMTPRIRNENPASQILPVLVAGYCVLQKVAELVIMGSLAVLGFVFAVCGIQHLDRGGGWPVF